MSLFYINMANMCETYGWTPEEYLQTDPFYLDVFSAVLSGRAEGRKQ